MPDAVSAEALVALETAVTALLPAAVPQGLTRQMRIRAQSIRLLGMGGYVGLHREPDAALYGRRIAARVDVDVTGGNDASAQSYAAALSSQVLCASRAETAQRGIQRIRGAEATDARSAAFVLDFEYVPVPTTGEGVIETLALETLANVTPYRTQMIGDFAGVSLAIAAAPLADFVPFTDAGAAPAGAWSVSTVAPAAIVQTAASLGGPLDLTDAQKAGTMLLWRPRGIALDLPRFVLSVVISSTSPDGVGVVFYRRAADDYAFFLASQRHGYHLFGRRGPGGWEAIASSALGFAATGASQRLVVVAYDGQLVAELDGRRTLIAATAPAPGGEVGLLTHGNAAARFTAGRLMKLVA